MYINVYFKTLTIIHNYYKKSSTKPYNDWSLIRYIQHKIAPILLNKTRPCVKFQRHSILMNYECYYNTG